MAFPMSSLQMSASDVQQWWTRVELSRARRRKEADAWKKLLKAYIPPPNENGAINCNTHFRNVELKKAQLFFQLPELQLAPLPALDALVDQTGQPIDAMAAVAAKRDLLNALLSRDYANVMQAAIDPALFDVLATSGIGATKICYEANQPTITIDAPTGETIPQPGAVLGTGAPPTPVTQPQQVPGPPVYERWRWYRFSPNKLLIPHDFTSVEYDEAPWLGMEFTLSVVEAQALGYIDGGFTPNATRDDDLLTEPDSISGATAQLVKGVEIWLRASAFDSTVVHREWQRVLVLIEGQKDKPAQYRASPYQDQNPDGTLGPLSMIGYPIHPFTVRDLSDSAYPPSDSAFTNPLVLQKNVKRAQDIKLRDANLPRFVHPMSMKEAIDKLETADVGQGVAVDDDTLRTMGEKVIIPLPVLEHAQSDQALEAALDRDIEETLGIGSNQAGTVTDGVRSATEVATVQANVTVRLQKERTRFFDRFLAGVKKFDALVMKYGDQNNLTPIIGPQQAQLVLAFKNASGRHTYDAKPDSQLSLDAAQDRKSALDYVNFTAKSPFVNQKALQEMLAVKFGFDPLKMVADPQPPGPPPPNVSFRFSGADLAIPEVRAILGVTMPNVPQLNGAPSPEALMALAQQHAKAQPHGGAADQADVLSKHHGDLSGKLDGGGQTGAPPVTMMGAH